MLTSEISLNFIASGQSCTDNSGNCVSVKAIVKAFSDYDCVAGLIDKDHRGDDTPDGIHILTGGERYSLENLLLDPVWVVSFFKSNTMLGIFQAKKYGFAGCEGNIQQEIDVLLNLVKNELSINTDNTKISVRYTDGASFEIPQWYLSHKGHELAKTIKEVFPELGKLGNHGDALFDRVLDYVKHSFFVSPVSIIETFNTVMNGRKYL